MAEEVNFVRDLAVILISAGIITIICRALKQPTILGYIIAGFIIGPHMGVFGISSMETVELWSDIGIIFLMFGLGLEFSFKKLLAAGTSSLVTTGSKFLGVFVIGYLLGQAMGWTSMESIFLAGLLSMSSTMVVVKSFSDLGLSKERFATGVIGSLVVEDLIAILLMVLLSTLAVAGKFSGGELMLGIGKLLFFLVLWFVVGIYLLPTIIKRTGKYLNEEVLLIISLGLCFGMVALAQGSGFSSELGAFMMGSILAETVESERIESLIVPIKDLFGAIFFVSVGMMLSPATLAQYWWLILILAVVVVVFDALFASLGLILSGGGLKDAVRTGFSLAQLGEFGFIIAGVGVSLGVMRDFIYPVIVAVSVITILASPYIIKLADPFYGWLRKVLPFSLLQKIDHPDREVKSSKTERSEWHALLKSYFMRVGIYGVVLIAILLVSGRWLAPLAVKLLPGITEIWRNIILTVLTLLLMSPFLYGLAISSGSINVHARRLIDAKKGNVWPVFGLTLARIFMALGFILAAVSHYIALKGWVVVAIILIGVILFLFARYYLRRYDLLEQRFLTNLNDEEKRPAKGSSSPLPDPDLKLHSYTLGPGSPILGRMLKESGLRNHGLILISVRRNDSYISNPSPDYVFEEGDTIWVTGSTEALEWLK